MFVKIYCYQIPKENKEEYLKIQEKVGELYSQYFEFEAIYLNDKENETKWMEIIRYKDEDEYRNGMELLNQEAEIHLLFKDFQSLLISEIKEEDFLEMKEIEFLNTEKEG